MKTAVAVLALLAFVLPLNAQLADTPWPMFRRDLRHTGLGGYAIPSRVELAWSYETASAVYSSPAIGPDGGVYVGSGDYQKVGAYDNQIYALTSEGALKWSYLTRSNIKSSPAVAADGKVYVGSDDNRLYAFGTEGSLAWSYETGDNVRSSPAIGPDGTVYFGSTDNTFYALKSDGSPAWSHTISEAIYCSPAVSTSDGRVFVGNHNWIFFAFKPAGGVSWSYESTHFATYSSPAIDEDGTVYVGDNGDGDAPGTFGRVRAFSSEGAFLWSYETARLVLSSPAVSDNGRVYVGSCDNRLYAFESGGALDWSFVTGNQVISSPALGGHDGAICVGSADNNLYAFLSSGSLLWSYRTNPTLSSPAIGSDGRIFVGSYDNRVYCLREAPTPTPTPPIDLTADKAEYGTTGSISVTADVWPLTVPCYPFVRIQMADGSTLYYQRGMGFTASPVPYLGFAAGTVMTAEPIMGYPALSANFSGIPTGAYVLEGGAVDMTRTTSASNLFYFGTVDREEVTVR
mgnify:CR=1 FL=1